MRHARARDAQAGVAQEGRRERRDVFAALAGVVALFARAQARPAKEPNGTPTAKERIDGVGDARIRAAVMQAHPRGRHEQDAREPALLKQVAGLDGRRADEPHEDERSGAKTCGHIGDDGGGQRGQRVQCDRRGKDAARGHNVALGRKLAAALGALRLGLAADNILCQALSHHRRRHGFSIKLGPSGDI